MNEVVKDTTALWREATEAACSLGADHWKRQYGLPDLERLAQAAWVHGYIAGRTAPDQPSSSASLNMEPCPDGSRVLCVADQPTEVAGGKP